MLRGIFRTKEGKIITVILIFVFIIFGVIIYTGFSENKKFVEQAVMAENYLKAGSYEQAVEAYLKALSMTSSDKQSLTIGLAEAYVGTKDFDSALEVLRSYYQKTSGIKIKEKIEEVTSEKTDYEYLQSISRAEVYFSNKEYDKAIEEYDKAKLIKSKESLSYKRIAQAYVLKGEYELAKEEIIEGQALTQDTSLEGTLDAIEVLLKEQQYDSLVSEAAEFIYQENYEEGIKKYKEAIKLLPEEKPAYKGLADVYMLEEEYGSTILLLQDALKLIEDAELQEILDRAVEIKEDKDERKNILSKLIKAMEERDIETIIAIMGIDTFKEEIVEDSPVSYEAIAENGKKVQTLIIYDKKQIYYGSTKNGIRSGNGIFFIKGKTSNKAYYFYDGAWSNDIPNGKGKTVEVEVRNEDGDAVTYKTITEGSYLDAYENGKMSKFFYRDEEETGRVTYKVDKGIPTPLTNESDEPIPTPEAESYIIGALFIGDQPTGEYYSIDPQTVWGVKSFLNIKH